MISRRGAPRATWIAVVASAVAACGGASPDPDRLCAIDAEFAALPDITEVTPAEALTTIETARALLDESVDVAPDEIRTAIELVRDGRQAFFDLIIEADGDLSRIDASAVEEAIDIAFLATAIAEADREWDIWEVQNCSA